MSAEVLRYDCAGCSRTYSLEEPVWRCEECGGHLNLPLGMGLTKAEVEGRESSLWRYRSALPVVLEERPPAYFGEGLTPLVQRRWGGGSVAFKLDYLLPSGSYKDRGSATMVNGLAALGISSVHEDSSGNAGASVATYCAAAGVACTIYAPASTSEAKLAQIEASGAHLVRVPGTRQDAAAAAAEVKTSFYAGHNWQPLFVEGVKTIAYELWEQHDFGVPDAVVTPLGGGALTLGLYRGFKELLRAGATRKLPRIYACQAANVAPLHRAFVSGDSDADVPGSEEAKPTVAEGVAVAQPVRVREVIKALRDCGGRTVAVPETDIVSALCELVRSGLYVEPTSGVAPAAARTLFEEGELGPDERVVCVLTGTGLKAGAKMARLCGCP